MTRVVKSYNGTGELTLRGGQVLQGRYHIDVSYLPVRRIHEVQGHFRLDDAPDRGSVVETQFAGEGRIAMTDGTVADVTLGGIVGSEVSILAMQPLDDR